MDTNEKLRRVLDIIEDFLDLSPTGGENYEYHKQHIKNLRTDLDEDDARSTFMVMD